MPVTRPDVFEAAASVVGATGAATVARGCVTARTGAGVYTVTLGRDLDAANGVILVTPRTAVGVGTTWSVEHTSDSVKTVRTFDVAAGANVATDRDFDIVAMRISSGDYS